MMGAMERRRPSRLRLVASNELSAGERIADAHPDAARPVPEDYGLNAADLRIRYAPGRVGAVLLLAITATTALVEAVAGARHVEPWPLGAVTGLLYGVFLGGFCGLGAMVLVHWCDPLLGRVWPTYGRLRRYREALSAARKAEKDHDG